MIGNAWMWLSDLTETHYDLRVKNKTRSFQHELYELLVT